MSKNVHQRIHAVMQEVKYVQKGGTNSFHKYKYASEADYISSIRPSLVKHGLVAYPVALTSAQDGELTTVLMTYRVVNVDDPSDFIDVQTGGQGTDKGDKAIFKAITGAKKYFLSTTLLVETGDDAEADASVDERAAKSEAKATSNVVTLTTTTAENKPIAAESKTPKVNSWRKVGVAKAIPAAAPKAAGTDTTDNLDL